MAVNDSDKKTRAISEKRVEKGNELGQFQEAQGQLFNIQAEQRNNLNEQRVISEMETQNNQTLAQAAGILAASEAGRGVVAAQPQQLNPNTRAILGKYGMGKPGTITKTKQNSFHTQQGPQRVNITNNTTTTTNNNIQLTQPNIPMSQPVIPMRAPAQSSSMNNFKVWVNNAFAKQNEAAAIREKEYRRREWSLTRSANKMIRKMGEIGKGIGDSLSPKNLSNALGDQFKVVLTLMGLHLVAKNIGGILKGIEEVVSFFTGKKDGQLNLDGKGSKFVERIKDFLKDIGIFFKKTILPTISKTIEDTFSGTKDEIISFIGGNKGETFFDALKGLFNDLVTRLSGEMNLLFESRARALKEVKFPNLDLSKGLAGVLTTVATYLGDVVSVAFGGTSALAKTKLKEVTRLGRAKSIESYEDDYSQTQDAEHILGKRESNKAGNTSIGDAVIYDKKFRENFKMSASDYNSFGGLSNEVGSSVKQSQYLSNLFTGIAKTGNLETGQVISGLSALKKSASKGDGALVSGKYLDQLGVVLGISEDMSLIKLTLKKKKVRYVVVPKTELELQQENAGSFVGNFATSLAGGRLVGKLSGAARWGGELLKSAQKGNLVEGAFQTVVGAFGSGASALTSATAASIRNWAHDQYTIKMVREDDKNYPPDKYPTATGKDGRYLVDDNGNEYYLLTRAAIKLIETAVENRIGEKVKLDGEDAKSVRAIDELLKKYVNNINPSAFITSGLSDYDASLARIEYMQDLDTAERQQFQESIKDDRWAKAGWTTTNLGPGYLSNTFGGIVRKITDNYKSYSSKSNIKGKAITDAEAKKNANYVMDRLVNDADLGLTPPQAAGIVGNLYAESKLNPQAYNKNGGASGIAQWLGDRKMFFKDGEARTKSKYPKADQKEVVKDNHGNVISIWRGTGKEVTDSTLAEQTEFLVHELKSTHRGAISKLRELGENADTSAAADIGLHSFEFRKGSLEGVEKEFAKHGQAGQAHIDSRRQFAADMLETWNTSDISEKSKWSQKAKKELEESKLSDEILGKFAPTTVAAKKMVSDLSYYNTDNKSSLVKYDDQGNIESIINPFYDDRTKDEYAKDFLNDYEEGWYDRVKSMSDNEKWELFKNQANLNEVETDRFFNNNIYSYVDRLLKSGDFKKLSDSELERLALMLLGTGDYTATTRKFGKGEEKKNRRLAFINKYATDLIKSGKDFYNFANKDVKETSYVHGHLLNKDYAGKFSSFENFKRINDLYYDTVGIDKKLDTRIADHKSSQYDKLVSQLTEHYYAEEQNKLFEDELRRINGNEDIRDKDGNYRLNNLTKLITQYNSDLESGENISHRKAIIEKYGGVDKINKLLTTPPKSKEEKARLEKLAKELIISSKSDQYDVASDKFTALNDIQSLDLYKNTLLDEHGNVRSQDYISSNVFGWGNYDSISEKEKRDIIDSLIDGLKKNKLSKEQIEMIKSTDKYKKIRTDVENSNAINAGKTFSTIAGDGLNSLLGETVSISSKGKAEATANFLTSQKYLGINDLKLLSSMNSDIEKESLQKASQDTLKMSVNTYEVLTRMAHNDVVTGYYNQIAAQALLVLASNSNNGNVTLINTPPQKNTTGTVDPDTIN